MYINAPKEAKLLLLLDILDDSKSEVTSCYSFDISLTIIYTSSTLINSKGNE